MKKQLLKKTILCLALLLLFASSAQAAGNLSLAPTAAPVSPYATPAPSDPPMSAPTPPPASTEEDQAFLDSLTLAFMDGIQELTPDRAFAHIRAVMVRVPEEKTGTAQWFVDGEAQTEYASSSFSIYNGKTTGIDLSVPFAKGTADSQLTVALEIRLNGAVRRIEKRISLRNYDDAWYEQQEVYRVLHLIQPVDIEAEVLRFTHTYSDKHLKQRNGSLTAGRQVIYTDHLGTVAACVWIPEENRSCWVPYASIKISDKDYTVYQDFTDTDKEIFVNAKGYESQTPYLIWINLERQRVNVFEGSKGNWELIRVSTCSSGANTTPTPAGVMTYCAFGNGWFHPTYYVKPILYMNLERGIAMHSILFSPDGTVQDGTQGTPASHGCVRMLPEDINWLAEYIPVGTTVVVF